MSDQTLDTAEDMRADAAPAAAALEEARIQPAGFLIVLSPDWIVLRASQNVDDFLGESHVTLVDEPLGRFIMAQPLHDLRNLFSRLSGTTGIARAYDVRLTDDGRRFDVAFQLSGGKVLFEGMAARGRGMGEALGSVGGLIDGLGDGGVQALLDNGARRMRALTGFDRVTVSCAAGRAQSSRGGAGSEPPAELPPLVVDSAVAPVGIYPRRAPDPALDRALLRAPSPAALDRLREAGIASSLSVPFGADGRFLCENRAVRPVGIELHAAAELFAQMFAMRLEIEALRSR